MVSPHEKLVQKLADEIRKSGEILSPEGMRKIWYKPEYVGLIVRNEFKKIKRAYIRDRVMPVLIDTLKDAERWLTVKELAGEAELPNPEEYSKALGYYLRDQMDEDDTIIRRKRANTPYEYTWVPDLRLLFGED